MRPRRHTNNKGRRMVRTGSHAVRLKRLALKLKVPYGKKEKD